MKFEVFVYVLTLAHLVPRPYYSPFFFLLRRPGKMLYGEQAKFGPLRGLKGSKQNLSLTIKQISSIVCFLV